MKPLKNIPSNKVYEDYIKYALNQLGVPIIDIFDLGWDLPYEGAKIMLQIDPKYKEIFESDNNYWDDSYYDIIPIPNKPGYYLIDIGL